TPPADELISSAGATVVVVNPPPPPTILQSFEIRPGILILKGFTEIGRTTGEGNSFIRVIAVEMTDPSNNNPDQRKALGLNLVVSAGRSDLSALSYIDLDEINGLISATEGLQKAERSSTSLASFEARYCTKGNLELTNLEI